MQTLNNYGSISGSPLTDALTREALCAKWERLTTGAEKTYWAGELAQVRADIPEIERKLMDARARRGRGARQHHHLRPHRVIPGGIVPLPPKSQVTFFNRTKCNIGFVDKQRPLSQERKAELTWFEFNREPNMTVYMLAILCHDPFLRYNVCWNDRRLRLYINEHNVLYRRRDEPEAVLVEARLLEII